MGDADEGWVDRYLERIGAKRPGDPDSPGTPDAAVLAELQERHLMSVPFENLDVHRGTAVPLTSEALVGKVVDDRRGGICYELNGAFAALLSALGFPVTLLSARVASPDGGFGPPFDHMALRVDLAERWLVDVGFGRFAMRPLRFDARGPQADPAGLFQLSETADGDLLVSSDGGPRYLLETRPRDLADFEATFWYQRTSPRSHFTKSLVCSLATADGRVSLSGRQFITTAGGARDERTLGGDDEVLAVYRDVFGIEPGEVPTVRGPAG